MRSALVADDSAVVRKVARRFLEDRGMAVSEAGDSPAALLLLASARPELMLLDWHLSPAAGAELVRQLRADPAGADLRLVIMMEEADLGQITLALRAGASDVMLKPFDRESFAEQLGL